MPKRAVEPTVFSPQWLKLLSPWLWPTLFALVCFIAAMGKNLSAFIFYPLGILFTLYSLWAVQPVLPTTVLHALHYDSLFFWSGILLSLLFGLLGLMVYRQTLQPERWGLLLLVYLSALLIAASGNLLLLFIGLESFFLLLVLWMAFDNRGQALTGVTIRLFLTGAFASAFMVFGMAFLFGVSGSLALSDIGASASRAPSFIYGMGLMLLLVGVFFKLSVVPFHHWTAEVYEDSPFPTLAMLATVSKLLGMVVLLKIFYHFPIPRDVLAIAAAVTMTVGNLGALAQNSVKRLLALSSISHVGFLLMGLASGNLAGFQAIGTYLIFYCAVFMGLVCLLMLLQDNTGQLSDFDGLGQRYPGLSALLTLFLLALAGIPPTLGFVAKWKIFEASFQAGQLWLVLVAALNSLLAAYYYLNWVFRVFMRQGGSSYWLQEKQVALLCALVIIGLVTVALSLFPQSLLALSAGLISNLM